MKVGKEALDGLQENNDIATEADNIKGSESVQPSINPEIDEDQIIPEEAVQNIEIDETEDDTEGDVDEQNTDQLDDNTESGVEDDSGSAEDSQ